jgi:hypothetical protein
MEDQLVRGYYSILRWRLDATRDEARNVAVLLVDEGAGSEESDTPQSAQLVPVCATRESSTTCSSASKSRSAQVCDYSI